MKTKQIPYKPHIVWEEDQKGTYGCRVTKPHCKDVERTFWVSAEGFHLEVMQKLRPLIIVILN